MDFELPDGKILTLPDGATGADAAASIGPGLARAALAVKVNGQLRDLARPLTDGDGGGDGAAGADAGAAAAPDRLEILTDRSGRDALDLIRHDAAHVLAEAVMELYPGVKISIGPPIEDGFYYDFDFPDGVSLSDADFERIESKMREHIDADEPFVREEVPVDQALERFRHEDQDYKVALIEDLVSDDGADTVSLYTNGAFTDLCRGPHAPSTKRIKAFKLQSVAGAYWRGDSSNPMLTRVYGTAFFSPRTSGPTSTGSSARAPTTTASSVPSSGCSRSPRSRPGRRSGFQPAPRCSTRWSRSAARWAAGAATPRSRRPSSTTARCG